MPNYDLLALDLDGTLLSTHGRIPEENIRAVAEARRAGIEVVVCTGRGWVECRHILEAIGLRPAGGAPELTTGAYAITAGGAITSDAATGRTVHRVAMPPEDVAAVVNIMHDEAHAALILKDNTAAGYDYLIVTGPDDHPVDPVSAWWFAKLGVELRFAQHLEDDEHPEHTVRVGACHDLPRIDPVAQRVTRELGERLTLHAFAGVVAPELPGDENGDPREIQLFEAFSRRANKWAAVERLAEERGVPRQRVAAIGDEINDVPMIRNAGLGIAMGNAVDAVRNVANRHTRPNTEAGVAHAIERILAGDW